MLLQRLVWHFLLSFYQAAHADVLHRNACTSNITQLALTPASPTLPHVPYVRWIDGVKAILVLSNAGSTSQDVGVYVPLATMGMGSAEFVNVTLLYGAGQVNETIQLPAGG